MRALFVSPASALDHRAEEGGRDLEVEDRRLLVLDRLADARVHACIGEVALDIREPGRQPLEHVFIELLARADDRLTGALDELLHRPVVERHSDDRAVQQAPPFEPVERPECHDLREIPGDPEDHEDIRLRRRPGSVRHSSPFAPGLRESKLSEGRRSVITRFG
jgi:hypothetical protein